jgi:predicted small metal-binding protein
MPQQRYRVDCGTIPSESGCTLVIEGPEEDLLDAAVMHAKTKHGHTEPDDRIREEVRAAMQPV